jgi:hypothetical protein
MRETSGGKFDASDIAPPKITFAGHITEFVEYRLHLAFGAGAVPEFPAKICQPDPVSFVGCAALFVYSTSPNGSTAFHTFVDLQTSDPLPSVDKYPGTPAVGRFAAIVFV